MKIISKISIAILVLVVSAQVGFFGTQQVAQPYQRILIPLAVAEANAPMHCTFKNNSDTTAVIAFYNEGNLKKAYIKPGANNYIFVDRGTTIKLMVYRATQSYEVQAGQYEFTCADDLTLDKAYE